MSNSICSPNPETIVCSCVSCSPNYHKLVSCKLEFLIALLSSEAIICSNATNWNEDTRVILYVMPKWMLHDCLAFAMMVEVMSEDDKESQIRGLPSFP